MSQQPRIEERPAQPYAGIRATVTMESISAAVDEAFPQLFGWLGANGVAPDGPPFIRYLVIDMTAELEIELGVPVGAPVTGSGRVHLGEVPGGRYAVLRHAGSYDGLIAANGALQDWAREHEIAFDAWETDRGQAWRGRFEHYLTDPSSEPNPANWQTDVAYLTAAVWER